VTVFNAVHMSPIDPGQIGERLLRNAFLASQFADRVADNLFDILQGPQRMKYACLKAPCKDARRILRAMPWMCSCGTTGNGRFCGQCGRQAPLKSLWKYSTRWLIGAVIGSGIFVVVIFSMIVFGPPRPSVASKDKAGPQATRAVVPTAPVSSIDSSVDAPAKDHDNSHTPNESEPAVSNTTSDTAAIPNLVQPERRTELRGSLARRREYDLWLIRNVSNVMNSPLANESRQGKILSYCMTTVYGAEQSLDSAPEIEYALQADGTVLSTAGKPPKTQEQLFRESQRMQLELETGGGPLVQDCAGSLFSFGTWHNKPMPSDEKFAEIAASARADLEGIDGTLDSRLVEVLPKPQAQR
jgi:hypothetical protein